MLALSHKLCTVVYEYLKIAARRKAAYAYDLRSGHVKMVALNFGA